MKKLIFIETDFSFIKNFENNLKKEDLSGEYSIEMIMPDPSAKKVHELVINSCVDKVLNFEKEQDNIYGIFVDICIIDGENAPIGIKVASILRKTFKQIPIFNITNKTKIDSDFDALSSATLENIDGVLVKSYLEDDSFSKKRFETIFSKAHSKRAITSVNSNIHGNTPRRFDIAILTALLKPELSAVKKVINNIKPINNSEFSIKDTTLYSEGSIQGKSGNLQVVIATDDRMGMPAIASLATRMIYSFQPKYIVILGIAAGIDGDTNIGDLLVTEYSWDYGCGKIIEVDKKKVFQPYINQLVLNAELRTKFLKYKDDNSILNRIRESYIPIDKSMLNIHIGPFASGAAVVSSDMFASELKDENKKLIGFDMEVYGVFRAAESFPDEMKPKVIAIKGVSDFGTTNKSNPLKEYQQAYAAYTSTEFFKAFVENEL